MFGNNCRFHINEDECFPLGNLLCFPLENLQNNCPATIVIIQAAYIPSFIVKSLVQTVEMRPCYFALVHDDQITCSKLKNHYNGDDRRDGIITHTIHSDSILLKPHQRREW